MTINKDLVKEIKKAINKLDRDYVSTKKEIPPMDYPIILKFYGADMFLSQGMTQLIFDNMQKQISNLEMENINLKMKKNLKERLTILFKGRF